MVYVMSGYGASALHAIQLAAAKGDITAAPQALVWKYDRDTPWVPSPLLYGDELYFLKSNTGILSVLTPRLERSSTARSASRACPTCTHHP
jgi:outer membrane protein assembly factor BamB